MSRAQTINEETAKAIATGIAAAAKMAEPGDGFATRDALGDFIEGAIRFAMVEHFQDRRGEDDGWLLDLVHETNLYCGLYDAAADNEDGAEDEAATFDRRAAEEEGR